MKPRLLAAALLCAPTLQAQELEPVIVIASRLAFADVDAPYVSEVHTREAIERSGAINLYDYLDQHTSVAVMPSFGNPLAPKLDMRGYGIGDGYQNVVVTLDGRRLNNIDTAPPVLAAIPLANVERIEIIKGSGSVLHGDAAMAGAIHIYTRDTTGLAISVAAGSQGLMSTSASAGIAADRLSLSVTSENYRHDGFRDADASVEGRKDAVENDNLRAMLRLHPTDSIELRAGAERARLDAVFGNWLTQGEFDADPAQNGGKTYTGQTLESDVTLAGITFEMDRAWAFNVDYAGENKRVEYSGGMGDYRYDQTAYELSLQYASGPWHGIIGHQDADGARTGFGSETSKRNTGHFLQVHYSVARTVYSLGVRQEKVEYRHKPAAAPALKGDDDLVAFDVGVNHQLHDGLTLFANYNDAFQAPDIDRFFTWDGQFNGFIKPARAHTMNAGINHVTATHRLKLSAFYARLENEIYYYSIGPWSGMNTNIDRSHKYGFELQEAYRFTPTLSGTLQYAYTRAVIDKEDQGGGAYDGKALPGVSPHSVNLSLRYTPTERMRWTVSHVWRSEAYAAEDFANAFAQKQRAYHATNAGFAWRYGNAELFAQVENLFRHHNGLWIRDDVIYPVNFERMWRFGIRAAL